MAQVIGQIESAKSLRAEFKYVKIKLLKELNGYLKLCERIFSQDEVGRIANFLVGQFLLQETTLFRIGHTQNKHLNY
jgi:hypothetical protein